jgi:RNase H-fold protein (predicted Holliday junction resolvase)
MKVLAIDPGREKCGVAVVEQDANNTLKVLWHAVVSRLELEVQLASLLDIHQPDAMVLGHATSSQALHKVLSSQWPHWSVHVVEETNSTLEARALYWEAHPPQGWRRMVPLSLQVPPVPIDDWAAVVLARRYLKSVSGK